MNLLAISPYVFGTSLTWYSVFVLMGAIVTYIVTEYFYKKNEESKKCPDLILNTFLIAFPSGLLGARIWYILSELDYYLSDPISMLKVWEGGLAIQGGVVLGALVGIYYVTQKIRKHGLNLKVTTIMDMAIPNILIAQVIGRWGNFFNREVYGACVDGETLNFLPKFIKDYMRGGFVAEQYIACPYAQYAQPLFLYEGLLNLLGFILISIVIRKIFTKRVDGTLTAFYLIWYGTVRACLEPLRNERFIMRWGNLSQSIITSIVFIILGAIYLIVLYLNNLKEDEVVAIEDTKDKQEKIEIKEEPVVENKEVPVKKVVAKKTTSTAKRTTTTNASSTKKTVAKPTTTKKAAETKTSASKKTTGTTKTSGVKKTTTTTKKTIKKEDNKDK